MESQTPKSPVMQCHRMPAVKQACLNAAFRIRQDWGAFPSNSQESRRHCCGGSPSGTGVLSEGSVLLSVEPTELGDISKGVPQLRRIGGSRTRRRFITSSAGSTEGRIPAATGTGSGPGAFASHRSPPTSVGAVTGRGSHTAAVLLVETQENHIPPGVLREIEGREVEPVRRLRTSARQGIILS